MLFLIDNGSVTLWKYSDCSLKDAWQWTLPTEIKSLFFFPFRHFFSEKQRDRQAGRPSTYLLFHCQQPRLSQTKEGNDSTQNSLISSRNTTTQAITIASQGLDTQDTRVRNWSQVLNSAISMWVRTHQPVA